MNRKLPPCLVVIFLSLACESAFATSAGQITLLSGRATAASPDGDIRELKKGNNVYPREFVSTGSNSFVNIKFPDGGAVLIKPNSRFLIEQYNYAGAEKSSETKSSDKTGTKPSAPAARAGSLAFFRLIKGGFRAVSGLIGKRDRNEYRVSTPVATIGIRGTDYEAILCDDACAHDPMIMQSVGITTTPEDGLVASVLHGGIGVTVKSGTVASSLRHYQAIAKALRLEPSGLMKASYRPSFIKVANNPNTYNVDQGETVFFPKTPDGGPILLPNLNNNIDGGLSQYSPNELCK